MRPRIMISLTWMLKSEVVMTGSVTLCSAVSVDCEEEEGVGGLEQQLQGGGLGAISETIRKWQS